MSTSNIVSINPDINAAIPGVSVTFETHAGELRTYFYSGVAALEILNGADPADFDGNEE